MLDQLIGLKAEHIREQTSIDGAAEPLSRAILEMENAMRIMIRKAKGIFNGYSGQIKDVHFEDWQEALVNKE
jgi:hypothetical protein